MPPRKQPEHVLSRGKPEAVRRRQVPVRVLLSRWHALGVSRGNVLPARGPLGPDAVPSGAIQRDVGAGAMHLMPEGVHLPRVRSD